MSAVYITWNDNASHKRHRPTNPRVLGMGNFSSSCWSKKSKRPSKQYRLLVGPLAASWASGQDHIVEDTTNVRHRTWRS